MEIDADALQLLLAEESQLYIGDGDNESCAQTCSQTCNQTCLVTGDR
ncbi:hypothetical protein ACIBAG_37790 [Streptomyces sp. NPDC051243]